MKLSELLKKISKPTHKQINIAAVIVALIIVFTCLAILKSQKLYSGYVTVTAKLKTPVLCKIYPFGVTYDDYSVKASQVRYFCPADYAIEASDTKYCKGLEAEVKYVGTASQKTYCLRKLAQKLQQPELCSEIKLFGWEAKYQDSVIATCHEEAGLK